MDDEGERLRAECERLREEVGGLRSQVEQRRAAAVSTDVPGPAFEGAAGDARKGTDGAPVARVPQEPPPAPDPYAPTGADASAAHPRFAGVSRRGLLVAGGAVVVAGGGAAAALLAQDDGSSASPRPRPSRPRPRPVTSIPAHPTIRRLATLKGHSGTLGGVWFSPDGRTLVSTEADVGNLRLWDVPAHRRIGAPLTSAFVSFQSVAISSDGRTLATGGADRAQFWQLPSLHRSGRSLSLPDRTQRPFEVVAFSPDGRTLAAGGTNEPGGDVVRLWDVASRGQRGEPLTGHEGGVEGLLFSPDGKTLAVSSHVGDGVVRLWDVASRRRRGEPLTGHEGGVGAMAFSPDSGTLAVSASVGGDGVVRLWDTATATRRGKPLRARTVGVSALAYSGDGKTIVTLGFYSGLVLRFWDAATHKERAKPLELASLSQPTAFTADGLTLATGSYDDNAIRLWRIE
ncbi:WD40 repeat domain-containing protein [Streptomyces iranensis]|uniref:WD40 repeat protein n=1 Tax=Streptomyces iranensis TaxID=576784 RepID=A0A060ZCP7_9ACTN|nr:WD40 repeat domain-containing protein [Streptomyces iranensis]MBP2068066.1 WD40 repeat protein [Streptomyces iranensis]CDR02310.1 WD40 repeat-containing protein [Streptomyces iranensis]